MLLFVLFSSWILSSRYEPEVQIKVPQCRLITNTTHGKSLDVIPGDIITAIRLKCRDVSGNGDIVNARVCEECGEGEDCFEKVLKAFKREGWNITCQNVVEIKIYAVTYEEVSTNRLPNETFADAYLRVFKEKCGEPSTTT